MFEQSITYTYDGDGDRVQKSNGKIYWYGAGTEILDETDLTGSTTNSSFNEYIYFGGERVARRDYQLNVFYYFSDQVGSSRGIAEVTHGGTSATLCYDADFFPFGGEHDYTNTCPQNYKFTGKERDPETNNDDFDARYYSSTYGRFLSADWSAVPAPVPYANLTNPQTLNLYAIVNDNPESFADLDGHLPPVGSENCGSNGSCGSDPNESANVSSINTGTAQVNQTQSTAAAQNTSQTETQPQTQTQTKQLSAADVSKGVESFKQDTGSNAKKTVDFLNSFGTNWNLSGDALRQGLKDSKVKTLGEDKKVDSISRTGDKVTVTLNDSIFAFKFKTSKNISFDVGSVGGKPALVNIQGVAEFHGYHYVPKTQYGPD